MKAIKYLFMAAATCFALTSCLDGDDSLLNNDWAEPEITEAPYGNNSINEENIITIADLKAHPNYKAAIDNSTSKLVEDDIKLRVYVTGNDIGGNLYKQFAVQDATGALIVAVNQGGLSGYLPEGQQIIIDLKNLYIGGYGSQIELGIPYNGQIGRMSKDLWLQHFKIVGSPDPSAVPPVDFDLVKDDIAAHCGTLVTLKNVTFKSANGKKTLVDGAQSGGNYYTQQLMEYPSSKVIVRTSSYADFAATVLPYDSVTKQKIPCNITGIATQFRGTWQIMMRKTSDFEVVQ
ncbi:MAG: DUF5689 domain-containing protein [Prevotella sp.]|nr:DUF5689 domain-containing protein [Prevotella sp.]